MNSKERIQSLKDYLLNKDGQFVRVIYNRNMKLRNKGRLVKSDLTRKFHLTGKIKKVKDNVLVLNLNDEKTLSIGLRVVESVYLLQKEDSLRIRYKLYYK